MVLEPTINNVKREIHYENQYDTIPKEYDAEPTNNHK